MAPRNSDPSLRTFDPCQSTSSVINVESDDDSDGDQTLTGDEFRDRFITPTPSFSRRPMQTIQDPEDDPRLQEKASLQYGGSTLKAGKTVELYDGDFVRITMILQHRDTQVYSLRGLRFRRIRPLDDVLEYALNEVVLLLKNNTTDYRTVTRQSTETVALPQIVRIREMVKTNQLFPALSCGQSDAHMGRDWTRRHSRLVCRWQFWYLNKNEGFLQALTQDACNGDYGVDSQGEQAFDNNVIDLTVRPKQQYAFGDGYCCAGGASRGAKAARLSIVWGFDNNEAALKSYALNFSGAYCYCVDAYDLIKTLMDDFKVDVLHISPPCKTYSPAHTRPGRNDEVNEATFLATEELIKRIKPRIVTLEETFGLTRTLDNQLWFKALLRMFSRLGFSCRWKVFDLCDYGLPQPRKRLILVASCPGEPLPGFPQPTHCKAADQHLFPQRKPFTTVNEAIANIPFDPLLHDPRNMPRRNEVPYDGNFPLKSTITCHSGASYHPSGTRSFTLREIACLQGFPLEHRFGKVGVREQIGNAFPPVVAKGFFESIIQALRKADGLLAA